MSSEDKMQAMLEMVRERLRKHMESGYSGNITVDIPFRSGSVRDPVYTEKIMLVLRKK